MRTQASPSCRQNRTVKSYLRDIAKIKRLTPSAEIQLAARVKQGDKRARERLIKANLHLVAKIAGDCADNSLPLLDRISEGNIGLIKAVGRFNPLKGIRIAEYGSRWIKNSISRARTTPSKGRLVLHG